MRGMGNPVNVCFGFDFGALVEIFRADFGDPAVLLGVRNRLDGKLGVEEADDSIGDKTIIIFAGLNTEIITFDIDFLGEGDVVVAVGGIAFFIGKGDFLVKVIGEVFEDDGDGVEDHHEAGDDRIEVITHDGFEFGDVDGRVRRRDAKLADKG